MNVNDKNLSLLIRCLGMLGSAHDGEIVNAGRTATKIIASMNVTWEALLTPPEEQPAAFTVNVGNKPAGGTNGAAGPQAQAKPQAAPGYRPRNGSTSGRPFLALHVPAGTHRVVAKTILDNHAALLRNTPKSSETDFLTGLTASIYDHITAKQFGWLSDIAARCGVTIPTL